MTRRRYTLNTIRLYHDSIHTLNLVSRAETVGIPQRHDDCVLEHVTRNRYLASFLPSSNIAGIPRFFIFVSRRAQPSFGLLSLVLYFPQN